MLGWAVQFFQISKNQRSPPPKLSTIEKNYSQFRRQSHEREKERIFIIHNDVFIACSSKLQHGQARFSLSLIRSSNAKWAVFLPSGSEQHTPNLACCERLKIEIFFLDKNHLHFFQVQTGMAISGLKTSHFVTYTSKRIFIVAINFNDKFWETVAAPVYKFHCQQIVHPFPMEALPNDNFHTK